jgi:hypothetical protein
MEIKFIQNHKQQKRLSFNSLDCIATCRTVTKDGVQIGNWIY